MPVGCGARIGGIGKGARSCRAPAGALEGSRFSTLARDAPGGAVLRAESRATGLDRRAPAPRLTRQVATKPVATSTHVVTTNKAVVAFIGLAQAMAEVLCNETVRGGWLGEKRSAPRLPARMPRACA